MSTPRSIVRQEEAGALEGCRILYVEDCQHNQRLVCFQLGREGAVVDVVEDGFSVLDEHERHSLDDAYDVVLVDMALPEMDGFETVRSLRHAGCQCPIVALTAHALRGDREKCIAVGCDDYAAKPVERSLLVDIVRGWWRRGVADAA